MTQNCCMIVNRVNVGRVGSLRTIELGRIEAYLKYAGLHGPTSHRNIRMLANIVSVALLEHCACSHCEATQWCSTWPQSDAVQMTWRTKLQKSLSSVKLMSLMMMKFKFKLSWHQTYWKFNFSSWVELSEHIFSSLWWKLACFLVVLIMLSHWNECARVHGLRYTVCAVYK